MLNEEQKYISLKHQLTMDPMELDRELIELPGLTMEIAELATEKLAERDRAKNDLDLAMAVAADTARQTLTVDGKGGSKVRSEAQIETEVPLYQAVQEAITILEKAKYELALAQALVDAVRAKRDALKTFADLTISGYLSPSVALDQRKAEMRAATNSLPRRRHNYTEGG